MIYKPLSTYTYEEIQYTLKYGSLDDIIELPLAVGFNCDNWSFAQNICIKLCEHDNSLVRANAVLGLSYIAMTKQVLDKRIVKPYILKELRENEEYRWRIIDSIKDINNFLDWNLAYKRFNK